MPCEHYKDALIDAAASGATPSGELRAHLSECASCRAAFDEEQSLYAAIDSGLHAGANAEVPPSLLPRVRASLNDAAPAHPRWSSGWVALAGAAVAAAAFLLAMTTRQNNPRTAPIDAAANRTPVQQILPSAEGALSSPPSKKRNSVPSLLFTAARNPERPEALAGRKLSPEVLVPHDQEILLASYSRHWDSRKHAPLVAREADQTAPALLEIPPIQITGLDVKPLAEGDSQ